jgi:hypothetical protein
LIQLRSLSWEESWLPTLSLRRASSGVDEEGEQRIGNVIAFDKLFCQQLFVYSYMQSIALCFRGQHTARTLLKDKKYFVFVA